MVRIEITQDDIDRGLRGDTRLCPVGRAAKRASCADEVRVGGRWCEFRYKHTTRARQLPPQAIGFIIAFDKGQTVKPFTFELEGWL